MNRKTDCPGCLGCNGGLHLLTGRERTYLEALRDRITREDTEPALMAELDEHGVVRLVPPRWTEQVARMIAEDIWDTQVEPKGDVS